jgi:hypothetical protein
VCLRHTPSFCSRCFPFWLITPNYVVYKSCGSYLPLRQGLQQSPLLSSQFRSLISTSLSLRHSSPTRCVSYLVCSSACSVCSSAWCVFLLGVFSLGVASLGVFSVARLCRSPSVTRLCCSRPDYPPTRQLAGPPTPTWFKRAPVSIAVL